MENEVGDNTNKDLLKPKRMRAAEGEIKPCGVASLEWSKDGGPGGQDDRGDAKDEMQVFNK